MKSVVKNKCKRQRLLRMLEEKRIIITKLASVTFLKEITVCRMTLARRRRICCLIMINNYWHQVMSSLKILVKVTPPLSLQSEYHQIAGESSISAMRPLKNQVDNLTP